MRFSKLTKLLAITTALAMALSCAAFADTQESETAESAAQQPAAEEQTATQTAPDYSAVAAKKPSLPAAGTYVEGKLLVKARRAASLQSEGDMFSQYAQSAEIIMSVGEETQGASLQSGEAQYDDWYFLELRPDVDMLAAWEALLDESGVVAVQPDYVYKTCANGMQTTPTTTASASTAAVTAYDPYIHAQTWLDEINAPAAWASLSGEPGAGVTVAVVDTGVDLQHPDLADNIVAGYDFVNSDADPDDDNGHGTHVAGIIAAAKNSVGVRGVACGAKIMPVKVMGAGGSGDTANIINGIKYASGQSVTVGDSTVTAAEKAGVINMSIGGYGYDSAEGDAIRQARAAGCLVVVAAGNDDFPTAYAGDAYYGAYAEPANDPGVLTVMAMDNSAAENGDWLASFSNYDANPGEGAEYEIMAPGVGILSTYTQAEYGSDGKVTGYSSTYASLNGTSMATPVVAGAAAVLIGMGCSADQAWELLTDTGTTMQGKTVKDAKGNDKVLSYPALNLAAAVEAKGSFTEPVMKIANADVYASLASVTTALGNTVSLSGLNTTSLVFFNGSEMLSSLSVSFDNFGGAGTVSVSGTVGGVSASGTSETVGLDGTGTVSLTIAGTPAADSDGNVVADLTLTPSSGAAKTVQTYIHAYDVALPAGISYNSANSRYELDSGAATATAADDGTVGKVLILDAPLDIAAGKTLTISGNGGGMVVYAASSDCSINNAGTLIIGDALLTGNARFVLNGAGTATLNNDVVYDPKISAESADSSVSDCAFYSGGMADPAVSCPAVSECGFYSVSGIRITCDYFQRNIVSRCDSSVLTVKQLAQANTFVENFGSDSGSVMSVYAPTFSGGQGVVYGTDGKTAGYAGFCFNSVIGPMNVYVNGAAELTKARVFGVYYQTVNNTSSDEKYTYTVTPTGVADELACDTTKAEGQTGAAVSVDDTSALEAFAADSPAFITGVTRTDYAYQGEGLIPYTLTFNFSTAVNADTSIVCTSDYDPTAGSASAALSADAKSCTVSGITMYTSNEMIYYYGLSGFRTAQKTGTFGGKFTPYYFYYTDAGKQSTYRFPITYAFSGDSISPVVEVTDGKAVLTWNGTVCDGYSANIYCSVDGGAYGDTPVGTVTDAKTGTFTDSVTAITAGHAYNYRIDVIKDGKVSYFETATLVYSLAASKMGMDFDAAAFSSATEGGFTVSLNGAWQAGRYMEITLTPSASGKLDAESIDFAPDVVGCGSPYGAIANDDGSVTVYIGDATVANYPELLPGRLFTIGVKALSAADVTVSVTSVKDGGTAAGWGKFDSGIFRYSPLVGAETTDVSGKTAQLWRIDGGGGRMYCAVYDASGKMTGLALPDADMAVNAADLIGSGASVGVFCLDGSNLPLWAGAEISKNG